MKVCLILSLLVIGNNAAKKINLEDIERDNLRAEGVPISGNAHSTKYPINKETNQQQYQIPSKYSGALNSPVAYVTPSSIQNVPPEAYIQPNRYHVKGQSYQQNNNNVQEQAPPQQYYTEYQQQLPTPSKGTTRNTYETQQLVYQPEVTLGNYWQSVQQRVASAKIPKSVNKETVYVNIPMMHLLTYYPNLDLSPGKSNGLLTQPALTTAATEQISIPLYSTSTFNQKPIIPLKPTYQIQYAPKHTVVPSAYTTKNAVYATPDTSKKVNSGPVINLHTYDSADQSVAQGKQFLYTQAYITPSKQQYVRQLVYAQPTTDYIHATPVYSGVYTREPQSVQDNSLHGSVQYAPAPEQSEPVTTGTDELPKQVLSQETSQTVSQNYVQDPEELSTDLVPPQLPPQDFHSSVTPLRAVPSQEEETISVQNHVEQSEPRSLLDSYVPSKIIAAQDSIRYQERPIKLESGFLPSKENFLYKKRKTE